MNNGAKQNVIRWFESSWLVLMQSRNPAVSGYFWRTWSGEGLGWRLSGCENHTRSLVIVENGLLIGFIVLDGLLIGFIVLDGLLIGFGVLDGLIIGLKK